MYLRSGATHLPATQATVSIEVFHPGEALPDRTYKKLAGIEMQVRGENSYGSILNRLKIQARKMGADAVIMVHQSTYTDYNPEENLADALVKAVSKRKGEDQDEVVAPKTYNRVYAIPIKYVDNLDYLEGRLQKIELRNSEDSLVGTIMARLDGKSYSIHSSDDEAQWYFDNSHEVIRFQEGLEWKSRYLENGVLERKKAVGKHKWNSKRYRVIEAAAIVSRIEMVNKDGSLDLIEYIHDIDNQLTRREWLHSGNPLRVELVKNECGRKVSSLVYDIKGDFIIKAKFYYHDEQSLLEEFSIR